MITTDQSNFQRYYEIAPITLVNGIAANVAYGTMTVLSLTEGTEESLANSNDYFAHFKVMPGSTLQEWGIAQYPFASMIMAANAVIQNPLKVSLLMLCPAQSSYPSLSYANKQSRITLLKTQLDQHISLGGSFTVATPAYTYNNCLLTSLRDVSSGGDKQVQMAYQWDFVQPLLTQEAATISYNALYNKLSGQLPTTNPVTNNGVDNVTGNANANQQEGLPPQQPMTGG